MKRLFLAFFLSFFCYSLFAQSVAFPAIPAPGSLQPWGYQQVGTNWDTSPYLPFYFSGYKMRIMPPNGVTYNSSTNTWNFPEPGKKYPIILFFHGNGEVGTDNNNQLKNGGEKHKNAVLSGAFPGFLLYPQSVTADDAKKILDRVIFELPIDINRIYVHGLSGGGARTWDFTIANPTLVAAAFPMSASRDEAKDEKLLYNPFRQVQGGKDTNPAPGWTQTIVDWYATNGGHLEYFYLPNNGHGTWDEMYNRADFFPWFLAQKKNKILVRYDRNELCPEAAIYVDMGFTPGFEAYEWRKDGVIISGATTYKLIATTYGSYTGRLKNKGTWTDWSDPVVVKAKLPTNTPAIQINGLLSTVLPALDGNTTTELVLPEGYQSYAWRNASNQVVSTSRIFTNVPVGTYTATANEFNGCSTIPSPSFSVVNANGTNKPDAISDFLGYAISQTQNTLAWTDKPSPSFNETGFEIYRSTDPTGSFKLVALTAADAVGYIDSNLTPNVVYYYKIRPVNQFSAGPVSEMISVLTQVDNIAPTAPGNLTVTGTTTTSASFSWTASTDNAAVYRYDIYKDGVKVLTTAETTSTVYNLTSGQVYRFTVKARDVTGNLSTESNVVIVSAVQSGLEYKYYEGTWSTLPLFTSLTPIKTGYSPNVNISVRNVEAYFGMYWQGYIQIPVAGNYTFMTNSDDGSKLYIGGYNESYLVVNNDGAHGAVDAEGTKYFSQPGAYPIVITYFQAGGGLSMNIYWKNTAHGVVTKTAIPNSAFVPATVLGGSVPQPPSGLVATTAAFNQINLTWTDNSNNETGFKIYRSLSNSGPFVPVGRVAANTTSYQDQGLTAATKYYYRITADGTYGESDLSNQVPRGLAYSYYEATNMSSVTSLSTLIPKKTGYTSFFDVALAERVENFGLKWVGKINITTAGTYIFFTKSDDGSLLYIDGTQIVSNDILGQANVERQGTKVLTVGWHDIEVRWRKATVATNRLTISYQRTTSPTLSKVSIISSNSTALFYGTEINATTAALPPAPLAPTNIALTNLSPTSFSITWQDKATDETSYQILRSYKQNTNFTIYKVLPANSTSFVDDGLFANATYFYKIQVLGPGGTTTSAQITGVTANNSPVLTALPDAALKFGKTMDVELYAQDADTDPITFSITGLPSFATLADHGDGTGNIHFSPTQAQLGNYTITVVARDNNAGSSSDSFVFTVTDKDTPEILPISDVSLEEGKSLNFLISASSDFGANNLTWSFNGMPEFATPTISNGLCSIALQPNYTHSGPYPVEVTVTDPVGSFTKKTFTINIQDIDPNQRFFVNIVHTTAASAPWNNMSGLTFPSLKDELGNTTSVGVAFQTTAWNTFNVGAVTGNNSGVFPDNVIQDQYFFGIWGYPETVDVKVTGLDIARKYNFSFFGSSIWNGVADNRSTLYSIGSLTVSLRVQDNFMNTAKLKSIAPSPDGSVTFKMSKASGAAVGYLNAFTLEAIFQDGTVPVAPRNVQALIVNNDVTISWIDAPFNEDGFDIYRAESENGEYIKLNDEPLTKNSVSYVDNNVSDGATYYYKLKAANIYGESPYSNTAFLILPNLPPRIDVSGDLTVDSDGFGVVSISTSSDAVLTISNLPGFSMLSPVTESWTDVILIPGVPDVGTYQFSVVALDAQGLTTTKTVTIKVNEKVLSRISVNFNSSIYLTAPAPWNNLNKVPTANETFSNLKNQNNESTGINLTWLTGVGNSSDGGSTTGSNSGIVPDNVLKEFYWFSIWESPAEISMKISGLSQLNKYRFKFVASSTSQVFTSGNNGSTVFTIGSKTASVNVQNNTTQLAVIEDVITNSQGEIIIKAKKGSDAAAGFMNGFILETLPVDPSKFTPTNLVASGYSKTQINLTWNDNSPVETGYEVYRSVSGVDGSYSLIKTTAPDISSYTDVVSQPNQLYYYKVRAASATSPSGYTNVAKSSAVAFKLLINVSQSSTYDAPAPWNNISRFGITGDIFYGFKDDTGSSTGLRFRVETSLEGANNLGMNTGNNSGVFPDKVLNSFWFNDAYFPQGVFVIDGLDQTYSYNLGFLGSVVNIGSAVNTDFTIGSTTVTNRNDTNISNVSYIRNVQPNANSEILFTVRETPGSAYSVFNAMTIEAFATGGNQAGRKSSPSLKDGNLYEVRYGEASNRVVIYPNPVEEDIHVVIEDTSTGEMKYQIYDLLGREVRSGVYNNDLINSQFDIEADLPSAIYLLKLTFPDGKFETKKFTKK